MLNQDVRTHTHARLCALTPMPACAHSSRLLPGATRMGPAAGAAHSRAPVWRRQWWQWWAYHPPARGVARHCGPLPQAAAPGIYCRYMSAREWRSHSTR